MGVDDTPIVESCPARAALAGNPSDGYGGAVVSIPVPVYAATVTLTPSACFEVCHSPTQDDTFNSWLELDRHLDTYGYSGGRELVLACIRRFANHTGSRPATCRIEVSSTIPRSVGLAGSSAIVVAALRALRRHSGGAAIAPDELASLALSVEVDELGISAGLQDRVVQAYGRPMYMQFGEAQRREANGMTAGTYEIIDTPLVGSIYVAWRAVDAEPSQSVHGDLRRRFESGEQAVRDAMVALSKVAGGAADALRIGDAAALGRALDASFDLRRTVMELRPAHVGMIEVARNAGAHANFAGSGGAIVVLATDPERSTAAVNSLRAIGCEVVAVHPSALR